MQREANLRRLFEPRSVVLVGATERSYWSNSAHDNLVRLGFEGPIHLVNPKGGAVYGRETATSCAAIGDAIDTALLMVPEAALIDAVADLGAAGIGGAVILTAGFAEMGPSGVARQQALARAARAANVRLLGPNCLGFVNYQANTPLWTTTLRQALVDRHVAIVSQSGATAVQIAQFAHHQQVGITHMISTGNEIDVDIADAIDFVCDDPAVRSIALFMESARRPRAFIAAVERARAGGKAVVLLKAGASDASAAAAAAHTGALVGDDRVFEALCRDQGLLRVRSIEQLVTTADIIARAGRIETPGLALVAMSGGLCEIGMDEADRLGVAIPVLQPRTIETLRAILPDFATPSNPLDVTGAALLDASILNRALAEIGRDPAIGLVLFVFDGPVDAREADLMAPLLKQIGEGLAGSGRPALMVSPSFMPLTHDSAVAARAAGIVYSGSGLATALGAIDALFRFSRADQASRGRLGNVEVVPDRPIGENAVLAYLARRDVPVIPTRRARTATEAVAAARAIGGSVVLKIASADIAHKTEIGGVALDVSGDAAVAAAFATMIDCVNAAAPDARIEGIEIAPMRRGGIELFVGTISDTQWGPAIAIGLGGVFVELLGDTSLRLLPIDKADALGMLSELRGARLLDGFRGGRAADRGALADAIVAIGNAALALGDELVSLEVNPLLVDGSRIEALDGLTVWAEAPELAE